jgi:hypothetical protein
MIDLLNSDLGLLCKNIKILNNASAWINSIDFEVKNQILYFVQKEQLFDKGIDGNNKVIGYYSINTKNYNPLKKRGEHYTLLDTGDFYKSMFVQVLQEAFEIEANGKKDNTDLFVKYGNDIVGLTNKSKEKLTEILTTKYIEYVRQILQLN